MASATTLTSVPLARTTGLASTRCFSTSAPRLPCRVLRRVSPGKQRPVRVVASAGSDGSWAQTSQTVEYSVPETTATGQASNPQYQTYHATNQYASMQPASLTSMGLRNFNLPNALRGPSSVVVAIAMIAFTIFTAVRRFLTQRTKNCEACKSYGIVRCSLCEGQGSISWEGKWSHATLCPGCFGKRHTKCEACGGMHNRSRFDHAPQTVKDPFPAPAAAATPSTVSVPSISSADRIRD